MCAPARSLQHLCFRCRRVRSIARCRDRLLDRDFLRQELLRKCEAQAQTQARTKPPDGECPIRIWLPDQSWSNLPSGPFLRTRMQQNFFWRHYVVCFCINVLRRVMSTAAARKGYEFSFFPNTRLSWRDWDLLVQSRRVLTVWRHIFDFWR